VKLVEQHFIFGPSKSLEFVQNVFKEAWIC